MKGLLSLIVGGLSFVIIAGAQWNAFLASNTILFDSENGLTPTVIHVHWSIKMIAASIALFAIALSISYTRSGQKKMNIANRVGRYLAILAVILSVIPVYLIFLK